MEMQHYKKTTQRELDVSCGISQVQDSLPNILAITGGVSARQKEGKETLDRAHNETMALFPMTASQPQC